MQNPMQQVTFLRGINVGGNHKASMSDLKALFESLGHTEVQTIRGGAYAEVN